MRPQRNAAENVAHSARLIRAPNASMRPQRNAAENVKTRYALPLHPRSFNEAAA